MNKAEGGEEANEGGSHSDDSCQSEDLPKEDACTHCGLPNHPELVRNFLLLLFFLNLNDVLAGVCCGFILCACVIIRFCCATHATVDITRPVYDRHSCSSRMASGSAHPAST